MVVGSVSPPLNSCFCFHVVYERPVTLFTWPGGGGGPARNTSMNFGQCTDFTGVSLLEQVRYMYA